MCNVVILFIYLYTHVLITYIYTVLYSSKLYILYILYYSIYSVVIGAIWVMMRTLTPMTRDSTGMTILMRIVKGMDMVVGSVVVGMRMVR